MLYAAIRVAGHSNIRMRNTKAYRAITDSELQWYVDNVPELNVVIFENIETSKLDWIINFKNKVNKICIVYYENNEIADNSLVEACEEKGISCIISLDNLQDYILGEFNEDVLTHLRTEDSYIEAIENEDGSSLFEELETDNSIAETVEKVDDSKEFIDIFNQNAQDVIKKDIDDEMSQNVTIKSKNDLKKNIDVFFDAEDEVNENAEESNVVSNEEVQRLTSELEAVKGQLRNSLNRIENLNLIQNELEAERDKLNSTLSELISHDEVTEVVIGALNRSDYETKIKELNNTIDELNIKVLDISQLSERVNKLNDVIKEKDGIEESLRNEIETLKSSSEVEILNNRISAEINSRLGLIEVTSNLIKSLAKAQGEIKDKQAKIEEVLNDRNNIQAEYTTMQSTIDDLNTEIKNKDLKINEISDQFNSKLDGMIAESNNKTAMITSLKLKVKTALEDRETLNNRFITLQDKFREVNGKLTKANALIAVQKEKLDSINDSDMVSLSNENVILGKTNDSMMGEIDLYQKRLNVANQTISKNEAIMADMRKQIEDLKTTNASILRTSRLNDNITFTCNYTGRGLVIPICGSGSVGVTTTAVSICNKLKGKVLLIDFDLVSPKANVILNHLISSNEEVKVSPIIKDLDGFAANENLYKSGLGALVLKDMDYFIDNEQKLIKNIIRTKDSRLDYISGLYKKANINQMMSTDFTQFMTYLGNSYDYIICDCGHVGCGEVLSSLQRMLDRICFKKILIARHEPNDIRNLALKIRDESFRRDDTIWMLNMARDNSMTEIMIKCLDKSPYVLMPSNMNMFGSNITYDKVRNLSSSLERVVNYILK